MVVDRKDYRAFCGEFIFWCIIVNFYSFLKKLGFYIEKFYIRIRELDNIRFNICFEDKSKIVRIEGNWFLFRILS